ncbi:MAG TPA: hypothetical protein VGS57_04625 [Thermoanaerobaculia bacterium]|nr:hypothetical protein [Thermoanaerobaculia bacterium]
MSEIAAEAAPVADRVAAPTGGGRDAADSQAAERAAQLVWQWRRAPAADERARAAAAARRKGLLGGLVGLAVAAALYFWKPQMALVVVTIAVLTTLLALVSPLGGFRVLTRALEAFAHGVGLVFTWVLMTLAYYLLFLPLGLVLRAAGKLHVTRGADARLTTYWQPSTEPAPGIDTYRRPF